MIERIAIILLVNLIFFSKTLTYNYVSDDIPSFQAPKNPILWKRMIDLIFNGTTKSNPQTDHFITTLIHAFTCVFIYTGFGQTDVSFFAALLFSLNPANNQGSVWISGRGYVMPALCMTMAMSLPFIGPLILLLATYYNVGFFAPLIFMGSDYSWFCLFIPLLWMFHVKRFRHNVKTKMNTEMFVEDKAIKPQKLVLAIKTFGFYIVHAILPLKNTFYHSFLQSAAGSGKEKAYTMKDRFFWIGLIFVISIVIYWVYVPWNMISFGLLWWCMGIAPFLNLFRMQQEIAERYMYLPNVGLMIVLSSIIVGYPIIFAVFMAMYATKMWFYMDAYQDDYYLVEQACLNSPGSWFAWHIRAIKRWQANSLQEAVILWVMAKNISPNEFKVLYNIAAILTMSNNKKEGEEYINLAEKNIPAGQEESGKKIISDYRAGKISILI